MSASGLRQPTRRFPLERIGAERAADLGVVALRCRAQLWVVADIGPPVPLSFVVDSSASYSLVSLNLAEQWDISTNLLGPEYALTPTTASGAAPVRVRPGRIRAWWNDDLRGHHFDWPVLFRVDAPLGVPSILGLGGVVKTCRWTFDGSYSPDSPFGYLTLDDIR